MAFPKNYLSAFPDYPTHTALMVSSLMVEDLLNIFVGEAWLRIEVVPKLALLVTQDEDGLHPTR